MNKEWKINFRNWVLKRKGYYISYNPQTGSDPISAAYNLMGNIMGIGEKSGEETALVRKGEYKILNGDFRKEYEKFDSYDQCLVFFQSKQKKFGSKWTTGGLN